MLWWNQGFCGTMGNYTFEHLNSVNLKHHSQTCSNNHLCQTTTAESAQANTRQSLLSNTTSNHFFDYQMKKTCLKQ